jgi:hypothetical protein
MNHNTNTWLSWITTGIGLLSSAAATKGVIDQNTAVSIAGAAGTLVPLLWGLFIHRDSKVVQTASEVKGIAEPLRIAADAPPALQALAKDDSVPNVKPEALIPNPYPSGTSGINPYPSATQRR